MSRAGRPKKGSVGLPEWFDIEKYRVAKSFKALEWFQQLAFRNFVHSWLHDEDMCNYIGDEWLLLTFNPVVTIARIEECYPLKYWSHEGNDYSDRNVPGSFMIEVMSLDARPVHGVSAITNGQLYEAYKKTPRAIEIHQKTFLNNKNENNFEEPDKQWITSYRSRYIDPGIPRADVGQFVCVDLSLPDAVLIGEFKDYLKRERKNTHESAGPFFRSPDFSSWYNMGVLPYLDLKLWEKLTGQSFQWSAFANALSTIVDKPIGSESALQKTVKKSAEKLMDYQAIRILKSQVVREQSGTLKKSGKLVVR